MSEHAIVWDLSLIQNIIIQGRVIPRIQRLLSLVKITMSLLSSRR